MSKQTKPKTPKQKAKEQEAADKITALEDRIERLDKAVMTMASMIYHHVGNTGLKRLKAILDGAE